MMIKIKSSLLVANIALVFSAQSMASEFVQIDPLSLDQLKTELTQHQAKDLVTEKYQSLIAQANKDLNMKNPTVMDKTFMPPSKDKHDYLSISRYWWPDPNKKDGLPWIRKDGQTNPKTQTDDVDRPRISLMSHSEYKLALAYYLTRETKYAQRASNMLKI